MQNNKDVLLQTYSLKELVKFVRKASPFYRELYQNISEENFQLEDLPIIEENSFWNANTVINNKVITADPSGIALKTGGTTAIPKISFFSREEWDFFAKILCLKLSETGIICDGDRLANMFISGGMYGSLLLTHNIIQAGFLTVLELPIGAGKNVSIEHSVSIMQDLKVNVLMGFPYGIIQILQYCKIHNIKLELKTILYSADMIYEAQKKYIREMYPNILISSDAYASTDSGFLGYADKTCDINEYRTDCRYTILEIVDEKTGALIQAPNIIGKLLATNLTKRLQPIIRYPVGDRAMWVENENSKFRKLKLMGRETIKDDKIPIGNTILGYKDFLQALGSYGEQTIGFQLNINNANNKYKIIVIIAPADLNSCNNKSVADDIKSSIFKNLPMLSQAELNHEIWPVEVKLVPMSEMEMDSRTYKAIRIITDKK